MTTEKLVHEHVFLGAGHQRNERRVWLVIALTASMMLAEIVAGSLYGSMALVADGWHMSTHAGAMLITALAYLYARRQARNPRFTFGTGKLGDLAGFASAIVLALIAVLIGWESLVRLANPVAISFSQAIAVAVAGLAVNLVSAFLLKDDHDHHAGHGHHAGPGHHGHSHGIGRAPKAAAHDHANDGHHGHDHGHKHDHGHEHAQSHGHGEHRPATRNPGADNNLRAAYLHVMADALTSVLAILALVAGSMYGWLWLDPAMGVVGALVIARWSWGLIRQTGLILIDATDAVSDLQSDIRERIETPQETITDLHVWQVGPGHNAAIVAIASTTPHAPSFYKEKLAALTGLSHLTVEVTPVAA